MRKMARILRNAAITIAAGFAAIAAMLSGAGAASASTGPAWHAQPPAVAVQHQQNPAYGRIFLAARYGPETIVMTYGHTPAVIGVRASGMIGGLGTALAEGHGNYGVTIGGRYYSLTLFQQGPGYGLFTLRADGLAGPEADGTYRTAGRSVFMTGTARVMIRVPACPGHTPHI